MDIPEIHIKFANTFTMVRIEPIEFEHDGKRQAIHLVRLHTGQGRDNSATFEGFTLNRNGKIVSGRNRVFPPTELADAIEAAVREKLMP